MNSVWKGYFDRCKSLFLSKKLFKYTRVNIIVKTNSKGFKRGRPSGYDRKKIAIIAKVLAENPDGLWLRKIAEKTHLHPNTVSNYVNTVLSPIVDDISLGSDEKPIIRVIRLKHFVFRKIQEGVPLEDILEFSQIIKNVGKRQE